ncbi:MAG: 2-aminoethylphosphonate--pyruvate transaminase [Planctomycetota bacterium]
MSVPDPEVAVDLENPYVLLTPGPLSTSPTVRAKLVRDWCTWDDDYNLGVVTPIREELVRLACGAESEAYTSVLMQGSGTFAVESAIGTVIPRGGKLLVLTNGAYGQRILKIAETLGIERVALDSGELGPPDLSRVREILKGDAGVTHVAMVHCETTTGMLNPLWEVAEVVREFGHTFIVDAMSSFAGVPIDVPALGIDFLISSANKCVQGVPGFGFVVAKRDRLEACAEQARSHSLDLFDQWKTMEAGSGKWRFTSPTHTVRAFQQALEELRDEGGIEARYARYAENHRRLVSGMEALGFRCVLEERFRSPIITAFHSPTQPSYSFRTFYDRLKADGFVIYPGKVADVDSFRIGTIGHVFPEDIDRLLEAMRRAMEGWIG